MWKLDLLNQNQNLPWGFREKTSVKFLDFGVKFAKSYKKGLKYLAPTSTEAVLIFSRILQNR